jgi:hypothetical protein
MPRKRIASTPPAIQSQDSLAPTPTTAAKATSSDNSSLRTSSVVYREVCGENFRDLLSDLSSEHPLDLSALEVYEALQERIAPQRPPEEL